MVFLPGLEEGVFPGNMARDDQDELEEERRLAYVAITRAKEQLFLCCVKERMLFGSTKYNPMSRFIKEIPQELIVDKTEVHNFSASEENRERRRQEINRVKSAMQAPVFGGAPKPMQKAPAIAAGAKVSHGTFGVGEVLSVRPMGTDVLYEIAFDSYGVKKLMGTYAKLKVIE